VVTERQLIYDIKGILRPKALVTESLPEEQIRFWIKNARAALIRQDYEKNRSINPDLVQTLCVTLEQVDSSECGCIETGCTVLRSTCKIPKAIETYNKNLITKVGPVDINSKAWPLKEYALIPWMNKNKLINKITKASIHNNYLYVISNSQLEAKAIVRGIFEDPSELSSFTNGDSCCYSMDDAFPISMHMVDTLKRYIIDTNKVMFSMDNDTIHDQMDNKRADV